MPADARDAVTLAVAGREHRDWESYSIDSDLFTPADAWQVSLGIPAGEVPASLHPWAEVELRLGTDTVLTGRIDVLRRRLARGAHSLTLHGRDRAAVLLDCSAPVLARRELSLAEICATWLRPLGIDRMDIQGGDTSKKVTVEPGMSAWEVLERAAEASGLWPWFAPDGVLHVAAPDYGRATDAELILRDNGQDGGQDGGRDGGSAKNNILDLSYEDDIRRRWSEVTVLGQGTGDETDGARPHIKAVARDQAAAFHRPLIRDAAYLESDGQAQARANKLLADSIFESVLTTARVRGHRTAGGAVWEPGMRVRLVVPPLGLDVDTLLARRTLACDRRNGTTTTLYLRPWGLWLPDTAPRARKKHRKKGGDCCDCDLCAG